MNYKISINLGLNFSDSFTGSNSLLLVRKAEDNGEPYGEMVHMLSYIEIKKLHLFINAILRDGGLYSVDECLTIAAGEFQSDEPPYDIYVAKNMAAILFTTNVEVAYPIPKIDFYKICLQMALKHLEAMEVLDLKGKGIVDDKWEKEIRELIPKIEEKVREVVEKYGEEDGDELTT